MRYPLRLILPLLAFLTLAVAQLHAGAQTQPAEKRVALVIGNSTYKNSPLKNPVNDAHDMAVRLKALGFEVIERSNLRTRQMGATLREFRSKLTPGAVALVFYAGHGVQIKGENYLPSVDAEIESEEDIPSQAISMRQVMDVLEESKSRLNLVFLDACRNNPYARSFRSGSDGLARVSAPSGTLISYATRPGSVAADGSGKNGLYTGHLLKQMEQANQPVEQVLKRVVTAVKNESGGRQEPWMEGSIEGDFCFGNCGQGVANSAPLRSRSASELEDELWASIKGTNSRAAFNEYLSQYPKGRYATQAAALARAPVADDSQQIAAWTRADQSRSVADYESYLARYPSGQFAALATSRIAATRNQAADDEAWARASKAATRAELMAYANTYPSGRNIDAARQMLRALPDPTARPALPFTIDEAVLKKLEESEAFQKTPPSKAMVVEVDQKTEIGGGSGTTLTEKRRVRPIAAGWLEQRSESTSQTTIAGFGGGVGSVQSKLDVTYWALGGMLRMGRVTNGVASDVLTINRIEGSLFPMREGATLLVEGRQRGNAIFKVHRKVEKQVDASSLSPQLTGKAWHVVPAEGNTPFYEGNTEVTDDYYLEDLGMFLSQISVRTVRDRALLIAEPGGRYPSDLVVSGKPMRIFFVVNKYSFGPAE